MHQVWLLIFLATSCMFTMTILKNMDYQAWLDGWRERHRRWRLTTWIYQMSDFESVFNLWAHWLLAIAYREAAMLLPLIMKTSRRRTNETRAASVKSQISTLNVVYYIILVLYLVCNELWWIVPPVVTAIFDVLA